MPVDNLGQDTPRTKIRRVAENGAGTYNWDVYVPANAMILDLQAHCEALWAAATSATMVVGDYSCTIVDGSPVIGAAISANGFFAATNLKATDLTALQSMGLNGISVQGGLGGAYAIAGTNTHVTNRVAAVDRIVRFNIVSVGAGTTGRTLLVAVLSPALSAPDLTQ